MRVEEIIGTLTDGWRPLEHCFLFQGDICAWDSETQMISTKLIDDDRLWTACEQFLMNRGLVCGNMDDVRSLAKRFDWPNWNR
jgi:hypothetical protein